MITAEQLRSAARYGTPLRKETLEELAELLDTLCVDEGCPQHGSPHICVDAAGVPNGN